MSDDSKTQATEVAMAPSVDDAETGATELEFTCSNIILPQEFRPEGTPATEEVGSSSSSGGPSKAEVEALIKVAVVESKTEMIATYAQATKSLEIEVNKIINVIYKNNPDLKNELLKIKKLVTDHSNVVKILSASNIKAS